MWNVRAVLRYITYLPSNCIELKAQTVFVSKSLFGPTFSTNKGDADIRGDKKDKDCEQDMDGVEEIKAYK